MKKFLAFIFCGVLIGLVLSIVSAEIIERTSGLTFCSSCHSMKRVSQSYTEDVHGGRNKFGFKAHCVDCHLPHDNVLHYVAAKAYNGAKDVLGELFWAKSFDWETNLKDRKDFAYTSGCQKCHNLDAIRYEIPKAYLAHKDFKMGVVTSCLHCHEHVGHKNIKDYLINQNS